MPSKRECHARGGVMMCQSPRCPEKIAFFGELEVAHRARDARDRIATVQAVMREQGFKAQKITGVGDILPHIEQTRDVWSKADMARLDAMTKDYTHIEGGKVQDLPIKLIQSTRQSMVKFAALHHYLKHDDHTRAVKYGQGVFNRHSLPVIIRNGDQYAVVDGTHRFVTSVLMGDTHIRAVVADLI